MNRKLTIEQRLELAKRYRRGASVKELSKVYNISTRQVYRVIGNQDNETVAKRRGSKHVTFRAPPDEIEAFRKSASNVGITGASQAFRALIRMATGLFELYPNQLEDFNKSVWLIGKEGQLLNQLAKNVHKGKLRLTDEDRILLSKCIDVNMRLHGDLRQILDEAKTRRGYSIAELRKAANREREK